MSFRELKLTELEARVTAAVLAIALDNPGYYLDAFDGHERQALIRARAKLEMPS